MDILYLNILYSSLSIAMAYFKLIGEYIIFSRLLIGLNHPFIDKEQYDEAINKLKQDGNYNPIIKYIIEHPNCRKDMSHKLIEQCIHRELKMVKFMDILLFNDIFWQYQIGYYEHNYYQNEYKIRTNTQFIEAVRDYTEHNDMHKLVNFITTKLEMHEIEENIEYMITNNKFKFSIESVQIGIQYQIKSDHKDIEYIDTYYPNEWCIAGYEDVGISRCNRKEFVTFLKAGAIAQAGTKFQAGTTGLIAFARILNCKNKNWSRHVASFL